MKKIKRYFVLLNQLWSGWYGSRLGKIMIMVNKKANMNCICIMALIYIKIDGLKFT